MKLKKKNKSQPFAFIKNITLRNLVVRINKRNKHKVFDFGKRIGKELL